LACLDYMRSWFIHTRVPPDRIVALITEMVQGVGGSVVPPTDYVEEIKIFLDGHGVLSIDDEVQTDWGRTGRMWATEHFDVYPDILISAKAIANGLPL
jgi:4-aminobutyrate aminotransferase-like enzyme